MSEKPSDRVSLRALARSGGGSLAVRVASLAISFASGIVLARAMGEAGFGLYNYALTASMLLTVLGSLRANALIVRSVSALQVHEKWGLLRGLLLRLDQVVLAASLPLMLIACGAAYLLAPYNPSIDVKTAWLALGLLPLLTVSQLRQGVLEGMQHIVTAQVPDVFVRQGLLVAVTGLAVLLGMKVTSRDCMAIHLGATFLAFVIVAVLARRALPRRVFEATPEYETRAWIRRLLPLTTSALLLAVNQQASTLMLGMYTGPAQVGIYAASARYATLLSYVLISMNAPLQPIVARLHAQGEKEELQRTLTRTSRVVLLTTLPLAAVTIAFAPWMLSLFGPGFVAGAASLRIMAVGQLLSTASGSVGVVLLMTGHERDAAFSVGIAALATIVTNAILIPRMGIEGAASGTAIGMIVWNLTGIAYLWKRLRLRTIAFG